VGEEGRGPLIEGAFDVKTLFCVILYTILYKNYENCCVLNNNDINLF
jgi:hypothetical protein